MQNLVKGEFRNNLERVIEMLSDDTHVKNSIDMSMYQSSDDRLGLDVQQHECYSTGCVLGHSLRLLNHNEFLIMNQKDEDGEITIYEQLAVEYFGIKHRRDDWQFLFGARWPNDAICCIERIRYYLDNEMNIQLVQLNELTEDYDYHIGQTTIDFIRVETK